MSPMALVPLVKLASINGYVPCDDYVVSLIIKALHTTVDRQHIYPQVGRIPMKEHFRLWRLLMVNDLEAILVKPILLVSSSASEYCPYPAFQAADQFQRSLVLWMWMALPSLSRNLSRYDRNIKQRVTPSKQLIRRRINSAITIKTYNCLPSSLQKIKFHLRATYSPHSVHKMVFQ